MRAATQHDVEPVIELLAETSRWLLGRGISQWPERFPREVVEDGVRSSELYVVERDGVIEGTITLAWNDPAFWADRADAGFVHRLAIRRTARGLGRELIEWADAMAELAGRSFLCLDCVSSNGRLRRYYEDQGFRQVGEISGPVTHPHSAAHGHWRAALYERPAGRGDGDGNDPRHRRLRSEARQIFGQDLDGYVLGRPEYPERVYQILIDRCGLRPGCEVLELGPGTGLATRRLLALGAKIRAIEPDRQLADYLRAQPFGRALEIDEAPFEAADVPAASVDLVVAATSFHWVDQRVGLAKVGAVLRPGGSAAIWWTVFGDPEVSDPYADLVKECLGEDVASQRTGAEFQLDTSARVRDLGKLGGLAGARSEVIRWSRRLTTERLMALLESQIAIRRRPAAERRALLGQLRAIAEGEFGGVVERPFVTVVCWAHRPPGGNPEGPSAGDDDEPELIRRVSDRDRRAGS